MSSKAVVSGISYGISKSLYDLYQYIGCVDRKRGALPGQVEYNVILNVSMFTSMFCQSLSELDEDMRCRKKMTLN